MSRARAYAAERAAEVAARRSETISDLTSAEILAAIEAELAPAEPARRGCHNHDGAALLADMARVLDGGAA